MTVLFVRAGRNWKRLALWATAVALGVHMAGWTWEATRRPAHGFVSHYTASVLVREGTDVARFYDDEWFKTQVTRFEPTVIDLYGANLPTTGLLLLPLTSLDYHRARLVWTVLSFLLLLTAVLWTAGLAGIRGPWLPAVLALTFVYQPAFENLLHGQMYVFVLTVLVIAWWAYRSQREHIVGGSLALLLVAKTTALMYWPLLILQKLWRPLAVGAVMIAAVALLSTPLVGSGAWQAYLAAAGELPGEPWLRVSAYQTIPGFIQHLLAHDPRWNPDPLLDAPRVATALSWLAGLSMFGASAIVAAGRRNDLVFAAFALLGLILSPVSIDYHYTMALLPLILILSRLQHAIRSAEGLVFITGALLIAADLPYRSARLAHGALALFAYPKLYGATLLWGLALRLALREPAPGRGVGKA